MWKLRTFEKEYGEPDKMRVTERIQGWALALLRPIVQNVTTAAEHRSVPFFISFRTISSDCQWYISVVHMELYHTLIYLVVWFTLNRKFLVSPLDYLFTVYFTVPVYSCITNCK